MKKILLTGSVILLCAFTTNLLAQESEYALNSEKKELKEDKRKVSTEEKEIRKEEKATRNKEVNYMTRQQFRTDFPDAKNAVFKVGKQFDEISFLNNNNVYIAFYDINSNLVGTTTAKQISDLPMRAQKIINRKYKDKGYSVARVILFDDNEANDSDMYLYDQRFDDEDVYFVELKKAAKNLVVQVRTNGDVSFFKNI
jgi:hypothetical protein